MDIWLNNQEDTDNAAAKDNNKEEENPEVDDMGLPYLIVQDIIK